MTPETVTALLGRIEKLPEEWRHRRVGTLETAHDPSLALDLHLRHIAEKLASENHTDVELRRLEGKWWVDRWCNDLPPISFATYPEALISAAEEVASAVKEVGDE